MNCKKFKIIFNAYIDNALTEQDRKLFELHLSDCAGCSKEYAGFQNIKQLVSGLSRQNAPANLENKVMEKIQNGVFTSNPLELFIAAAKTSLIAAVFIFGIIAALSFFTPSAVPNSKTDNVDAMSNYILKGNIFAKQNGISDAKIMQALLG
ncbi:MAG: zf-HC2 domain-containing protein [Endomicrobia bacterium]|nr:zf-HC2 domain-containing protein [Bacillota bacterium]MCL1971847.1 zf-HC2 domain-containing protein [Endomicrobiia bacterium]